MSAHGILERRFKAEIYKSGETKRLFTTRKCYCEKQEGQVLTYRGAKFPYFFTYFCYGAQEFHLFLQNVQFNILHLGK